MQEENIQIQLYRARLLLEEGQADLALQILQRLQYSEEQGRDVAYLLGWCHIQRKQWKEAVQALTPLVVQEDEEGAEESNPIERERLVHYLLRIGIAAVNLSRYEDAALHFTLCLKVLHDRRVHLPAVRIKARYSLAMTYLMRGLYTAAIQHYEEALRLCRYYDDEQELPHIYYGLCDSYRHTGDYVKACLAGEEALQRYEQRQDRPMEARMHNMLGHIRFLLGDFRAASDHYTSSLAISTTSCPSSTMAMLNCAALADLRMAEGRIDEARRYCKLALVNMDHSDDPHMCGNTYHVIGRVVYKEAQTADPARRLQLLNEAISWYEKAGEQLARTQAYPDMAEVYGRWAQALEDLGRGEEALMIWKRGYKMLAHPD